jgi:mono/diheme cytochrome c family protein/glucose/arabinose dehydrogenase
MTLPQSRLFLPVVAASLALMTGIGLAIHPQNAGPAQFEIKFKLPPPKPLTPEEELASMKVAPGFKVELFAAEPLIETPIAMSWDEQGRMYVLEMRGYMQDVEGKGEDQPLGRVTILEDTNGDGKADKRTVFADGLTLPRAVMCVNGGALVSEPPVLWFMKDIDGDGKADVKEPVDHGYASRNGQPEHMANSPTWCLDNWIYSSNHGTRYRLKDGKFVAEPFPIRGQWGLSQDDYGRLFYNFNSDFLRANLVPENLYRRNPNYVGTAGVGIQIAKDQTIWPSHPTPGVNRGYDPGTLRPDGTMKLCSATCGAAIYRGGLFGKEFAGNAFIPEPAGNLVKRFILEEKDAQITARNAYKEQEFLTSTDERFRPVTAYTGPDGALYLADMYRGIIQHKGFLTYYLVANIKDRNLEQPVNMGRIWRIVPDKAKPQPAGLPKESAELVKVLGDQNGWKRDTAQRILVERKDASVTPALTALAANGSPIAKIHAIWTLEGMGALTPDVLVKAFADGDAKVRATAVRLADRSIAPQAARLVDDPSIDVQIALALNLSGVPEGQEATLNLVRKAGSKPLVRDSILSGLRGRELEFLQALLKNSDKPAPPETLEALAHAIMTERRAARVQSLLSLIASLPVNSENQLALLGGAGGKLAPKGAKPKLIYVEAQPAPLVKLAASLDAKAKPLLASLDARIAWPNKPGVPPPPVIQPLNADEQKLFATGKQTYTMICAACHQPNGQGMDGLAPPLVDSEWAIGKPEILPRIVMHGLTGPIKVNGTSWSLEMPPLGAALTDEQVAGVATYIRREWEHTASPVTVDFVKKIRTQNKERTKAWNTEDLREFLNPRKSTASEESKASVQAKK